MGRAARLTGLATVAVAAIVAAGFFLLPLVVRVLVRGLALAVSACVWFAASLSAGADAWTILRAIGRAIWRALVSPQVFVVVGGLVLVGALALYGLQRMLGSDEESSR